LVLLATLVLIVLTLLTLLSMLALLTLLSMLALLTLLSMLALLTLLATLMLLLAALMLVLLAFPRFVCHCVLLILYLVCGDNHLLLSPRSSPYPRCCAGRTCFARIAT
jgi:hypothetical protein